MYIAAEKLIVCISMLNVIHGTFLMLYVTLTLYHNERFQSMLLATFCKSQQLVFKICISILHFFFMLIQIVTNSDFCIILEQYR